MGSLNRALPSLRRIRLSNSAFQRQSSPLRPQQCRVIFPLQHRQLRWQHAAAQEPQAGAQEAPPARSESKQIKYTSESYPQLQRDARFKELNADDVKHFREIL